MYVKKCRRNRLRPGFLTCTIREIDNSRCVSYFSADPKENDRKLKNCMKIIYDYSKK